MPEVFISYSSSDDKWAEEIYKYLKISGIDCWKAPDDINPGEKYGEALSRAIRNSKIFVLIFSQLSNQSEWVEREVERAVSSKSIIITFRIEDVLPDDSLDIYLGRDQWLDAFKMKEKEALDDLIRSVKVNLDRLGYPNPSRNGESKHIDNSIEMERDLDHQYILGIDLGTYNSAATVAEIDDEGEVINTRKIFSSTNLSKGENHNEERLKAFPSFVSFFPTGKVDQVGVEAKKRLSHDPKHVVWGTKRLLGKSFAECSKQGELERYSYSILSDPEDGECVIEIGEKMLKPVEVTAEIVKNIKAHAEEEMGVNFREVVISIPAYFDAMHATPIIKAAKMAEFEKVTTIPEPVAASIAYEIPVNVRPVRELVFDLGGGTLDVTVGNLVRRGPKNSDLSFQSKITTGNTHLGGLDMDDRLMRFLIHKSGIDRNQMTVEDLNSLRKLVEEAKIRLSTVTETEIEFSLGFQEHNIQLNLIDLENALRGDKGEMDIIEECRDQVNDAIRGSFSTPEQIDRIIVIGGPSTMPCIIRMLKEVFNQNTRVLEQLEQIENGELPVDPMEAVALGAALSPKTRKLVPHAYGYGFVDLEFHPDKMIHKPVILIPKGSVYPTSKQNKWIMWSSRGATTDIEIIQQMPGETKKYMHLGFFSIASSDSILNLIEIGMELNENEELVTTLRTATGQEAVYVGVGHMGRDPVELPREIEYPAHLEDRQINREMDENVLRELVQWSSNLLRICERKMDTIDEDREKEMRKPLYTLKQLLTHHACDSEGEIDLKKARISWYDILDKSNQLLHQAGNLGVLEAFTFDELKNEGRSIKTRLFILT